jgi:hypothetical protein
MTTKTLKLEEIEKKKLKDILQAVSTKQQILTVRLPNGDEVIIQPKPPLEPLPILEGFVPEGWKEAIYE